MSTSLTRNEKRGREETVDDEVFTTVGNAVGLQQEVKDDDDFEISVANRRASGLMSGFIEEREEKQSDIDLVSLGPYEATEQTLKDLNEKNLNGMYPDGVIYLVRNEKKEFRYIIFNGSGIFGAMTELIFLKMSMMVGESRNTPFKRYLDLSWLEQINATPRLDIVQEGALILSALFSGTSSFQLEGKTERESLTLSNEKLARIIQQRMSLRNKRVPVVIIDFSPPEMKWLFGIYDEWTERSISTLINENFSMSSFRKALRDPVPPLEFKVPPKPVSPFVIRKPGYGSSPQHGYGGSSQKTFSSPKAGYEGSPRKNFFSSSSSFKPSSHSSSSKNFGFGK